MSLTHVVASENAQVFHYDGEVKSLAPLFGVDAYIVSAEDGFSPLGSNREFLANDLNVPEREIRRFANWCGWENPNVSLVAVRSQNPNGVLKGIILAPTGSSKCYARFGETLYNRKPSRNFFYNVSYEAFAYAARTWGARKIAISHLSACNRFHPDIATCAAEAYGHLSIEKNQSVESLTFLQDSAILMEHMDGVCSLLNPDTRHLLGSHTPAFIVSEELNAGHEILHISVPRGKAKLARIA